MRVLVAYATRHGATAGIAERVAATLTAAGLTAEARAVGDVGEVGSYDAVVLGGAAYLLHWLKPAVTFARRHSAELAARPVWLFSSGPLGADLADKDGRNVLDASRPREFDELATLLHPRGERVFFGAYDPDAPPVGLGERLARHIPAADALPTGDFRDWPAIDAWAGQIATELTSGEPYLRAMSGSTLLASEPGSGSPSCVAPPGDGCSAGRGSPTAAPQMRQKSQNWHNDREPQRSLVPRYEIALKL